MLCPRVCTILQTSGMAFYAAIVFGLVFDFLFQSARSYCVILLQVLLDILQRGFCHPFGLDYQRGRPNLCPASTTFRRWHRRWRIRQCDGNSSKFTPWGRSRYQLAYEYLITSVRAAMADFWQTRPPNRWSHPRFAAPTSAFYSAKSRQDCSLAGYNTSCGGLERGQLRIIRKCLKSRYLYCLFETSL